MYKQNKITRTSIEVNATVTGETIETKIERIVNNKEPITDGAPVIYTERKDGVMAGYDIRTDRFDIALDAMDKVARSNFAKRDAKIIEMKQQEESKSEGGENRV